MNSNRVNWLNTDWDKIPKEVWSYILAFLPSIDILNARKTHRYFDEICTSNPFQNVVGSPLRRTYLPFLEKINVGLSKKNTNFFEDNKKSQPGYDADHTFNWGDFSWESGVTDRFSFMDDLDLDMSCRKSQDFPNFVGAWNKFDQEILGLLCMNFYFAKLIAYNAKQVILLIGEILKKIESYKEGNQQSNSPYPEELLLKYLKIKISALRLFCYVASIQINNKFAIEPKTIKKTIQSAQKYFKPFLLSKGLLELINALKNNGLLDKLLLLFQVGNCKNVSEIEAILEKFQINYRLSPKTKQEKLLKLFDIGATATCLLVPQFTIYLYLSRLLTPEFKLTDTINKGENFLLLLACYIFAPTVVLMMCLVRPKYVYSKLKYLFKDPCSFFNLKNPYPFQNSETIEDREFQSSHEGKTATLISTILSEVGVFRGKYQEELRQIRNDEEHKNSEALTGSVLFCRVPT